MLRNHVIYLFAGYSLDSDCRELRRGSDLVPLEPQVFDLLQYLISRRDCVVSKDEIIEGVWNGRIVSESTISSRVTALRRAIGDSGETQRLIRTIQRKGLRFVGDVREEKSPSTTGGKIQGGAFYPRQPAVLSDALLVSGLSLLEHAAIAVLPFNDMSATHDQQYLADGITEELITGLAKIPELIVIARNSTFTYKDKPTDIRQVGKDLNVRYVLEGSTQRADQNVRVTAQLIDTTTGHQIWADRYDRQVDNIFAIRDDITRSIAGTLGGKAGKLAQAEAVRVSGKNPNSFTAYDCVMKGWYAYNKFTREDNVAARDLFEQARKIDPNYARAYAGLAWTYQDDYDFEWTDDDEKTLKLELEYATTAVRLDRNDNQAQWALGWSYLYNRKHDQAMAHYLRARKLNPNDAEVLAEMGSLLIYIGQPKQAIDQEKEAIRLNPNHYNWYVYYMGWAYEEAGMPKEAIEIFEQAIDLQNPDEEQLWYLPTIAAAYAHPTVGRMDDARKVVKTVLSRKPDFSISKKVSRYPYKTKELADRYANALRRAGLPE